MSKLISAFGVSAAAAAFAFFAYGAQAQQKAPATAAKSVCNQITEEAKCKADAGCSWIAALTDSKTGKQKRKAYCKTKPKPPVKKKDAAKK